MFDDWFHLIEGWIMSMYIPVVPLGLDIAYPAELQNLCEQSVQWESVGSGHIIRHWGRSRDIRR